MFVGYDLYRKEWKCMDPEIKKFVISRDVVFDEVPSWFTIPKSSFQNVMLDDYKNESLSP